MGFALQTEDELDRPDIARAADDGVAKPNDAVAAQAIAEGQYQPRIWRGGGIFRPGQFSYSPQDAVVRNDRLSGQVMPTGSSCSGHPSRPWPVGFHPLRVAASAMLMSSGSRRTPVL